MMLKALLSTFTELLDSKKAAYSFVAVAVASVLHVYFGVSTEEALLLVSPLVAGTVAQAHVDAAAARSGAPIAGKVATPDDLRPLDPPSKL